jgi:hypothetical protein
MENNILNTWYGSYIKVFLTVVLTMVLTHGSIFGINWKEFANAAVMSFIPILINALNPNDPRYGSKKDTEIIPKTDSMKSIILLIISAMFLTGCSPAFGGGGFIIPLAFALAAVYSAYKYVKTKSDFALWVSVGCAIAFGLSIFFMASVK